MEKRYRVLLWGAAQVYNEHYYNLRYREERGELEVVGIYDRSLPGGGRLDGWPLLKKEELLSVPHDYLLIMSGTLEREVTEEYLALGGSPEKVLPCRILDVPGLTFSRYEQIREARYSILAHDCLGGFLSNTLCLERRSPFVNLWLYHKDYREIVTHLKDYLALEPVFDRWKEAMSQWDTNPYPVLRLGDVRLYCNHDSDPETAIRNWERRKQRVDLDRLLLTVFARSREAEEEYLALDGFARKLVFTSCPDHAPGALYIPSDGREYWD
ncbi:MAG: DUF1919 domain-containing protein [Oscillospiraceae bacterium]|nr:DUF1919 domain-containing protein [Oscillospiraceae bacterium]